jgi:hypothetical protein
VFLTSWLDGAEISGLLRARVTQTCSATADDFETPIDARFDLRVLPANSKNAPQDEDSGDLGVDPDADDPPDVLEGDKIDVSAMWSSTWPWSWIRSPASRARCSSSRPNRSNFLRSRRLRAEGRSGSRRGGELT